MRSQAWILLGVILGLGLLGVARADQTSEAAALMEQGMTLLQKGNLEEARDKFVRARLLVPDKANPYRLLGIVDARLGRCADAVSELEIFLGKVPATDSRTVEAITLRDRCKEELQPKTGTLSIDSTPPGAEVRIDDEKAAPVGVTPYRNPAISVGAHVAYVRKGGFVAKSKGFQVERGQAVQLDVALEAVPVPVVIVPAPLPPPPPPSIEKPVEKPAAEKPAVVAEKPAPPPKKKSKAWIAGVVVPIAILALGGLGYGICAGVGSCGAGNHNNNGGGPNVMTLPPVGQP
jgi:hypothetical protein